MSRFHSFDRRLGKAMRARADAVPGVSVTGRLFAESLAPLFQSLVTALIVRRESRSVGVTALVAGTLAASVARVARDRIARPRPGARSEGGLPSRHAAAAVAITRVVGRRRPQLRPWLAVVTVAGLTGRVVTGQHDPADIASGAAVGWMSGWLVTRLDESAR